MTDLSRREALLLSAAALSLAGAPAALAADGLATTWDLTQLYPDDAAWTAERLAVEQALPTIGAFKGRLGESAATLRTALQTISDLDRRVSRLGVYAGLKGDEDLSVSANQERRQLSIALYGKLGEATAFVAPEVLGVGAARIDGFLAAEPGLSRFAFGLRDILRQAPHTLDNAGEALLASTTRVMSSPREIRSQLFLSDLPWTETTFSTGKVRVDPQAYAVVRALPDRAERKKAMDTFFGAIAPFESSLGAALSAEVQGNIFRARARRFESAVASSLADTNIPVGVYTTLVAEANRGLPVLHRYFDIRRRMLGLSDLAYYDIYPAVTKLDRKFGLAETRELTLAAVKPLGPEYVETLAKATAARWMDVYPRKGKYAGAYMNPGAYDVHPYLLLNHTDDYEGLTTFAHEWGHGMHSLLSNKTQPYDTAGYPIFTAEIASTLNEHLLTQAMLKQAKTKAETLFYLDRVCELLRATFYRQTMFAEFELAIHQTAERGEALSGKAMSAIYLDLLKRYHGPGMTIDPLYAIEWAYPQHFYMNFYVFKYATSVSASAYFADRIAGGKVADRETYLNVLRAGGSDYAVDILKRAGVDMTSPEPYRALVARFSRTLDQMEALLKT